MGPSLIDYANYFDVCRIKRNISDYTSADEISPNEVRELIKEVMKFKKTVLKWMNEQHPDYL